MEVKMNIDTLNTYEDWELELHKFRGFMHMAGIHESNNNKEARIKATKFATYSSQWHSKFMNILKHYHDVESVENYFDLLEVYTQWCMRVGYPVDKGVKVLRDDWLQVQRRIKNTPLHTEELLHTNDGLFRKLEPSDFLYHYNKRRNI